MKISTKGRYGILAILDLALHQTVTDHVSLSSIAERQQISLSYLEQMFSRLRKAGYVKSIKGPQGGYRLAHPPAKITAGEILRSLEGDVAVVEAPTSQSKPFDVCLHRNLWQPINQSINHTMDGISLEDLMVAYQIQEKSDTLMFYI